MTVKLSFEFDNIQQATEFCMRCQPHATQTAVLRQTPTVDPIELNPAPEPKKRGRPAKSTQEESPAPAAPPAPPIIPPPVAAVVPSSEAVIAALKALANVKGLQVAISLLSQYKTAAGTPCTRGSEVQEQDRAGIIERAKAA